MTDENKVILGKNIQKLMIKYNFSLSDLARLSKVNKSSLHNWINGGLPRGLAPLIKISNYFDISIDQLVFEGTELMPSLEQQNIVSPKHSRFEVTIREID